MANDRIRVFIGTEPKTELARLVLEDSIRRHARADVEFTAMIGPEWEYPLDNIRVGTGFSLRRWMIPAFCKWQGRAIYLDADQLVFGDIQELWSYPDMYVGPSAVWCTYQPDKYSSKPWPQTSVMVIDCAAAKGQWGFEIDKVLTHLRGNPTAYPDFMHGTWLKPGPIAIPVTWNHLNYYEQHKTKLLHYTKEPEQPWYKPGHSLAYLWKIALTSAMKRGVVTREHVEEALGNWNKKQDWREMNGLHPDYRAIMEANLPPRKA